MPNSEQAATASKEDALSHHLPSEQCAQPSLDDPWDPAAAEALIQIYETDAAGLATPLSADADLQARLKRIIPAQTHGTAEATMNAGPDRAWIESRFSEIVAKIECLRGTPPAADTSNPEGLDRLQRQVGELSASVREAQRDLSRVLGVEAQLSDLKESLSVEKITSLIGAVMPTTQEVSRLAEIAAEKTAARLQSAPSGQPEASGTPASQGDARFEELCSILGQLVEERQQNEQRLGEALDTMQQALEHILSRIDGADLGRVQPESTTVGSRPSGHTPRDLDTTEPLANMHRREASEPPPLGNLGPADASADQPSEIDDWGYAAPLHGFGDSTPDASRVSQTSGTAPDEPAPSARRVLLWRSFPNRGLMVAASLAAFLASGYWLIAGSQSDSVETTELNTSTLSTSQAKGTSTVSTMLPEAQSSGSPAQHDAGASQSDQSGHPKAEPFRPTQADNLIPPADRPLQGVAVAHDSLTPEELVRVQQNQRMAVLSSRMGRQSAHAFAHPIAVAGEAPASVDGAQSQAGADIHRAPLELPPLMIGPQSLRLAAANGDASAQFEVAARFAEGKGVPQSFEQAALWYQRAAAQGLAVAQYRLATLYERGLGEQADPARARVWYQRAAEHGNVKAMHNLAVLSAGRDGTPDYATAAHWFTEAAERGLADSQYNLGILYESGRGVPKEPLTAYRWYALAAASGDKEAERRRDLLGSKIGPQLRKPVEEEVSKWRPRVVDRLANDSHAAGEAWKLRASGSSTN